MTNSTLIEYKGCLYHFQKPSHLTEKMFQDKCWFIVKNKNVQNIEDMSNIWIASKYYKTGYSEEIMQQIAEYEKNMSST